MKRDHLAKVDEIIEFLEQEIKKEAARRDEAYAAHATSIGSYYVGRISGMKYAVSCLKFRLSGDI